MVSVQTATGLEDEEREDWSRKGYLSVRWEDNRQVRPRTEKMRMAYQV